jgi:AraC-like DNA-binding protein
VDPLADVLDLCRVRGALIASVRAAAPWGLDLPQSTGASVHAITSGHAWLRMNGREPVELMPGDLLLLPTGAPHRLSSDPNARCLRFDRTVKEELMSPEGDLELDGPGATTTFVCAGYDYDHDVTQPLMGLLPEVLHVPADPVGGRRIAAIVDLLAGEVGARGAGTPGAVARLIDLLLIAAIRAWTERESGNSAVSWLRALRDPVIARVLGLLHERPGDPWTVDALAREVHLSRATLARRFTAQVGDPPLTYLTHWRMDLAAQRLKSTADTVEAIARSVGYSSEYASVAPLGVRRARPPAATAAGSSASARTQDDLTKNFE